MMMCHVVDRCADHGRVVCYTPQAFKLISRLQEHSKQDDPVPQKFAEAVAGTAQKIAAWKRHVEASAAAARALAQPAPSPAKPPPAIQVGVGVSQPGPSPTVRAGLVRRDSMGSRGGPGGPPVFGQQRMESELDLDALDALDVLPTALVERLPEPRMREVVERTNRWDM
jgi:hypothetical protein